MNEPKTRGRPAKSARSLEEEIAEAEARLLALRQRQEEERLQREREVNQQTILALVRDEGLDAAPVERWQAVLPKLRQLLKLEAPAGAKAPADSDIATPADA